MGTSLTYINCAVSELLSGRRNFNARQVKGGTFRCFGGVIFEIFCRDVAQQNPGIRCIEPPGLHCTSCGLRWLDSANIIEASWRALSDSLEYALVKLRS